VSGALFLLAAAAVAGAGWYVSLRWHPYAPCRACRGRRGRNRGSTGRTWGHCRRCGGKGERLRFGARMIERRKGYGDGHG
jgi:hypothetical protein